MAGMSRCLQKSTSRPWKASTCDVAELGGDLADQVDPLVDREQALLGLVDHHRDVTTSYSLEARAMMSRCPLVMGSNDPGQTARRTGGPSLSGPVIVRLRT